MRRILLIASLLLLALPASASAESNPYAQTTESWATFRFPGQRPANDPWLVAFADSARTFWAKRNVIVPQDVSIEVADDLGTSEGNPVVGIGYSKQKYGFDRLVIDNGSLGVALATARNKRYTVRGRRRSLDYLATVVFHELGHVAGLEHTKTGLMGPSADTTPHDARLLIRRLIPSP